MSVPAPSRAEAVSATRIKGKAHKTAFVHINLSLMIIIELIFSYVIFLTYLCGLRKGQFTGVLKAKREAARGPCEYPRRAASMEGRGRWLGARHNWPGIP
jgi:hypothetical protein